MISEIFQFVFRMVKCKQNLIFISEDGEVCLAKGRSHNLGLKMFTVDESFVWDITFGQFFLCHMTRNPRDWGSS